MGGGPQCKYAGIKDSFCFKSPGVENKTTPTASACEPGLLEVLLFNEQSRRSCNDSVWKCAGPGGEAAVEEVHHHQITLIPTLREVYGWSYQ